MSTAEPTRNLLYGACAKHLAFVQRSINSLSGSVISFIGGTKRREIYLFVKTMTSCPGPGSEDFKLMYPIGKVL